MLRFLLGLLISLTLLSDIAWGGEGSDTLGQRPRYRLLDVDRLDFTYQRLRPETRDPYAPEYTGQWRERAALEWDLRLFRYGYWRNNIHTETVNPSGVVKTVGWQWELGVELGKYLDLFTSHHSRHIMEEAAPEDRFDSSNQFPVEDAYGIRLKLLHR